MRPLFLLLVGGLALPAGAVDHGALPAPAGVAHPASFAPDTVVAVGADDRIHVQIQSGRVSIEGRPGETLEVLDDGRRSRIEVIRRGNRVEVRSRPRGRESSRTVHLRVPPGTAVEVDGHDLEVEARGLTGGLRVGVVEGDLSAFDIEGGLELRAVDGDLVVERVRGGVVAATVDGDVRVAEIAGRVTVESMDGDLVLDQVDGDEVIATTVDGTIHFAGPLRSGSQVRLVTHDGDVSAEVPADVSADVEVSTFSGEFVPGFPVRVGRVQAGQPLRFRLGDGAARLEIQVFDGDIQLRHRPGR